MKDKLQQYYHGITEHNFHHGPVFEKYRSVLKQIHDGHLKEDYFFKKKYETTEDLRPTAYNYDDSIIDILNQSNIHQKMIDLFGYELFLGHVQIRMCYPANPLEFSYMPWHRDTYLYEGQEIIGPVPPMKKLIYYPRFDNKDNWNLAFALGSHLSMKFTKQEDLEQLESFKIYYAQSSINSFIILNTEALHHALPPENEKQLRIVYSFCPIGQIDWFENKSAYNEYVRRLE